MEPTYPIAPLPPPDHHHQRHESTTRLQPTQAFADRILRAIGHRLLLLYRSDPNFYVLGATGNVYVVNVSTTLACSCPDRATPCKHILFVLIKVLGVPLDEPCLRKRTLRPSHLAQILANPSLPDSFASPTLCQRFYQAYFLQRDQGEAAQSSSATVVEDGVMCPICLDEMGKSGKKLVACGTCRNCIHEECLMAWKRTQRRRTFSCVICRSRWKDMVEQERYLNLAAYVNEDDHMGPQPAGSTTCHE